VSITMLVSLANARPYINWSDDVLAQCCQFTLGLVQIVGLLQMNECVSQDDWLYGPVLIFCTVFSGGLGIALILMELLQAVAPKSFERIASKVRFNDGKTSLRKSSVNTFSNATSVVPVDLNGTLPGLNINSGAQTERAAEAPSPSVQLQGPPAFKEQSPSSSKPHQQSASIPRMGGFPEEITAILKEECATEGGRKGTVLQDPGPAQLVLAETAPRANQVAVAIKPKNSETSGAANAKPLLPRGNTRKLTFL
jgi:hypothetical protein